MMKANPGILPHTSRPRSDGPRAEAKNAPNHAAAPQEGPADFQAVRRDAQELPDARGDAAARTAAERKLYESWSSLSKAE